MAKKLPPAYLLGEFQFNLNFKNGCVVALYIVDSTLDWTVVPTSAKEPSSNLGTIVPPYFSEKKTLNHRRIHKTIKTKTGYRACRFVIFPSKGPKSQKTYIFKVSLEVYGGIS